MNDGHLSLIEDKISTLRRTEIYNLQHIQQLEEDRIADRKRIEKLEGRLENIVNNTISKETNKSKQESLLAAYDRYYLNVLNQN